METLGDVQSYLQKCTCPCHDMQASVRYYGSSWSGAVLFLRADIVIEQADGSIQRLISPVALLP